MIPDRHTIPITILICEHDEADRRMTRQALEGARVANALRFVEDGEQCLDYLRQRGRYAGEQGLAPRPGLILLDVDLPDVDGRGVLQAIRSDPMLEDIPVVVLSSSSDDAGAHSGHDGVTSFMTRPVTFPKLRAVMNELGRHWLAIVESPQPL